MEGKDMATEREAKRAEKIRDITNIASVVAAIVGLVSFAIMVVTKHYSQHLALCITIFFVITLAISIDKDVWLDEYNRKKLLSSLKDAA